MVLVVSEHFVHLQEGATQGFLEVSLLEVFVLLQFWNEVFTHKLCNFPSSMTIEHSEDVTVISNVQFSYVRVFH